MRPSTYIVAEAPVEPPWPGGDDPSPPLEGLVLPQAPAIATRVITLLKLNRDMPTSTGSWETAGPKPAGRGGSTYTTDPRPILREGDTWKLWYTGYDPSRGGGTMKLGHATSPDGLRWTRHSGNPVFDGVWTEDVFVLKHDGVYHMFAEGRDDVAHRLTSLDGLRWEEQGRLDVRTRSGTPIPPGPYGTPGVLVEGGTWHLFYERGDLGVWLATSTDLRTWTNVSDEPVLALGPEAYDRHAVALNHVLRRHGRYYGVYHANADPEWKGPWTTCLAASDDLVRWQKYPGNPVIRSDDSSGILVDDGDRLRLYTMHPEVRLWIPRAAPLLRPPAPTLR
jgi:beta-1,2-mannobiose phosphorylase / 1,2-beta-oligomannan phosphorylase